LDADGKVTASIGLVVIVIVLLAMTPVIIAVTHDTLPAGNWPSAAVNETWNFTGASGAESILGLVPFVWIASVLIACAVGMFSIHKSA